MGRPRKEYGSEQGRIEARKQANRDRVKRHRDAKKAQAEEGFRLALDTSDCVLPSFEDLQLELPPQELARRAALQRARDMGIGLGPVYDDGIEVELPNFDGAGES